MSMIGILTFLCPGVYWSLSSDLFPRKNPEPRESSSGVVGDLEVGSTIEKVVFETENLPGKGW